MAKVVNITDKLEFDVDPTLVIGNLKVRVHKAQICFYRRD